jgi:predicted nucleic acid-binding protein
VILVDTSVWVDHLRRRDEALVGALEDDSVLVHPFVMGELALGGLTRRAELLGLLGALPRAVTASHDEALRAVGARRLDGKGIGWVDAHLFASALLSDARLWTRDKRLLNLCFRAGIAYAPVRRGR